MSTHILIPFCTFSIWNELYKISRMGGNVSFISNKLKCECSFDLKAKGLASTFPRSSIRVYCEGTFKECLSVERSYPRMLSHSGLGQIGKE